MNISEVFHNRYELLQRVGSGGFSEVWKANDMRSGMEVAIKIFRKQDDEGITLCREEYLKAFEMSHSRIMTPFHFDVDNDRPYLVMRFMKGGTLSQKIGKISVPETERLITHLSEALQYLHHKTGAIVHGDIKPDNILIDEDGNYYLTDFGISTRLQEKFTETMMMPSDISLGKGITPMAYRSPENFKYKNWVQKPISPKSDIWSAGVTIYHAIYGQLPFNGEGGLGQLIMMISGNHEIEELMDFPEKDAFEQFHSMLQHALELEPSDRQPIFDQIIKNQNNIVIPIQIDPKKINEELPKKKKESKLMIYLLLFILVITAAGIGYNFIGKDQKIIEEKISEATDHGMIEISDDTLEHMGRKDEIISHSLITPENNQSIHGEINQINVPAKTENNSPQKQINLTHNNNPVIAENQPSITDPTNVPTPETKITVEENKAEIKPIIEEKKSNKTATIKPNITIPLTLNEDIINTGNYPAESKISFIVAADVLSYGDVIIRKGTEVMAEVKKRSDKKLSIRFPNIYTSGGTKLKGLNLDNLEINIDRDRKGSTYHPVTSSYQTNVLIN